MKNCKWLAGALGLAASLVGVSAQAQAPQVVAVGSSGIFTSVVIAMVNGDPITGTTTTCGSNVWTAGAAIASGLDNRSASIPSEGGNVAIVWDNSTSPTIVCAYLSVDSVVGQRLFLGQAATGNATLQLTAAAQTTAGANKVSFIKDITTGLPTAVYNLINGAHFNVAFTDIRPEDGVFAYNRAASTLDPTSKTGLGYGPQGGVGVAVLSSYDTTSAQVVAYAISGNDPFSTLPIPAFKTVPVGASPVVVFYNTTDTSAGGLGTLAPSNVPTHVLANFFAGNLGVNEELTGVPAGSGNLKVIHVVNREPVSGTYNTFEWQVVRSRDGNTDLSQESGFGPTPANCITPPATATFNPPTLNGGCTYSGNPEYAGSPSVTNFTFGNRTRAIGTGQEVSAVNSANNPNSLGYAFFGLGTFGGKTNVKYITVDGVDPIYATYSGGALPNCSGFFNTTPAFSCVGALPTFANVAAGNYRTWSLLRAVVYQSYTAPTSGPSVFALIQAAQDQAHTNIPDFIPYQYCANSACSSTTSGLHVFRSHYNISGFSANNGTNGPSAYCAPGQTAPNCIESGGDMLGSQFLVQSDVDYFALTGNEFVTYIE
jgi:hypothetical protein